MLAVGGAVVPRSRAVNGQRGDRLRIGTVGIWGDLEGRKALLALNDGVRRIKNLHRPARNGNTCRARAHGQGLAIGAMVSQHGPASLGGPHVVAHRAPDSHGRPVEGVRIASLASNPHSVKVGQIVVLSQRTVGIFALDGAKGGGRGEEAPNLVLRKDAPVGRGVRGADRLALEQDGGASTKERAVNKVGMTDGPAEVARPPPDFAWKSVVHPPHAPVQGNRVPARVADDSLGLAGRPAGVEDIQRVAGLDPLRGRVELFAGQGSTGLLNLGSELLVSFAAGDGLSVVNGVEFALRAVQEQHVLDLVVRDCESLVHDGLVLHNAPNLNPTGCGDHKHRLSVVDANCQLWRSKASEDNTVNSADTS
mmetsp:Transcript_9553/g.27489  ORF Transcript_9553/g.27489 Transcript_9553/m.27489 type:complete len:365 (-) Transcript_9553:416-1510(-)